MTLRYDSLVSRHVYDEICKHFRFFSTSYKEIAVLVFLTICIDLHRWHHHLFCFFESTRTTSWSSFDFVKKQWRHFNVVQMSLCLFQHKNFKTSRFSFRIEHDEKKNERHSTNEIFRQSERIKNKNKIFRLLS